MECNFDDQYLMNKEFGMHEIKKHKDISKMNKLYKCSKQVIEYLLLVFQLQGKQFIRYIAFDNFRSRENENTDSWTKTSL